MLFGINHSCGDAMYSGTTGRAQSMPAANVNVSMPQNANAKMLDYTIQNAPRLRHPASCFNRDPLHCLVQLSLQLLLAKELGVSRLGIVDAAL